MTPEEGYEIADVLVDGKSQGAISSYTFTNVTENHTISVFFRKKETSGGTETPGGNEGGNSGTETPGGNSGSENPGGNEGGNSGSENPGGNEGGSSGSENSGDNAGGTGETGQPEAGAGSSGAEGSSAAENSTTASTGSTDVTTNSNAAAPGEPKTGDPFRVELYATAAMIAGLLYLLLCFAEKKGLTETRKEEIISSIIRWAKEGGKCRKYAAVAAIFFVLAYYHSIGKNTAAEIQCAV